MKIEKDLIDKEYERIIHVFKPVFGNDSHIELAKSITTVSKLEADLAKMPKESPKARVLSEEIYHKKRSVIYAIKNQS